MPKLRILADCSIAGAHASAGEVVTVSDVDAVILIGCGRGEAVATAAQPSAPKGRTKAEIEADLEAAKLAEAQLQADLSRAS